MRKLCLTLLVLVSLAQSAGAAIPTTAIWEFEATGTAGMLNGGGFDPAATFAIADATATAATGNSPEIASATYTFVAADVANWIYIKAGTHWIPGWYKIASINGNNAVVNATIGAAIWVPTNAACTGSTAPWPCCTGSTTGTCNGRFQANTVAGVSSVATENDAGTLGVDYSQVAAAQDSGTDLASADGDAAPCVVTSATHNFVANDVGNAIHITAGTGWTAGWYFVASVTGNAATLDRACGTDGAKTGGTWYLGGALDMNSASLLDPWAEQVVGGNKWWIKAGTYTVGQSVSLASASCTTTDVCSMIGYNTLRGDEPTGTNRPLLNAGATAWGSWTALIMRNLSWTGTASTVISMGNSSVLYNVKVTNTSLVADRTALGLAGQASLAHDIEGVSQNGYACTTGSTVTVNGFFCHDSKYGIRNSGAGSNAAWINGVSAHNRVTAVVATDGMRLNNVTLYGSAAKHGTGIDVGTGPRFSIINSILYGFATGASATATYGSVWSNYNDWYNLTTETSNVLKGPVGFALDPQFDGATEIVVTGATSANNSILTCSTCNFSTVTDNEDYFVMTDAGTNGVLASYLITTHDTTTLTLNGDCDTGGNGSALGGFVSTGHNFNIGENLRAAARPGALGAYTQTDKTTTYVDIGGVQRQERTPIPTATAWPNTPTSIPTCN